MRMGLNFPVRCSQWSVVSPILRAARASARVKRRGATVVFTAVAEVGAKLLLLVKRAVYRRYRKKLAEPYGFVGEHCAVLLPQKTP